MTQQLEKVYDYQFAGHSIMIDKDILCEMINSQNTAMKWRRMSVSRFNRDLRTVGHWECAWRFMGLHLRAYACSRESNRTFLLLGT